MSSQLILPKTAELPDESIVRLNSSRPTEECYSDFLHSRDFLNDRLFGGRLSSVVFTLARKPGMLGAFCPHRFESKTGERAHEIILNPFYLALRPDRDTLSTLAHEMAHQWREDFGPKGPRGKSHSRGYHDEVWADCMEGIGLMPSTTGGPGGERTGTRVSHYIIDGGAFDVAARELLDQGFVIRWRDRVVLRARDGDAVSAASAAAKPAPKRSKDRVKFSCPSCRLNAWAKPSAVLTCAPCNATLIPQQPRKAQP
jgi:hypothetical protein